MSVQVNVDAQGDNIPGDAANEPSIAIDPTDPDKVVIGWRQFDNVASNFRQAGWGYSHDGGQTWTFPGVLEPDVFRSDPVLAADADGNIHYYSLTHRDDLYVCDLFTSVDGGLTWNTPVYGSGGDKAWMTIDRTSGPGRNHIYAYWTAEYSCCDGQFVRSTDGGQSFGDLMYIPGHPRWGTLSVGPDGEFYVAGEDHWGDLVVARSTNAQDPAATPLFELVTEVNLGGRLTFWGAPNPSGLCGQVWTATDHSGGPTRGNVYLLGSVEPVNYQPDDVMFIRSTDGGQTWSEPLRVNDDPEGNEAWQWFGTMSVAPSGRIDVVWNDTRNTQEGNLSELYYAFSADAGWSWSVNIPVSPVFDSHLGWPDQHKIGDYYHVISDDGGANVAYAATFNGEQDVYFLRITADCNGNSIPDIDDLAGGTGEDCDGDAVPDECERDFDGDGVIDGCDTDADADGVTDDMDMCLFTPLGTSVDEEGRPHGDYDGDCQADLRDWAWLPGCLARSGPGKPHYLEACIEAFDVDGDTDVDLDDVADCQNGITGSF